MANFINKKEEVMQLKLTNYGKSLFSQGKLDPVYYSFYDSDILYDGAYGGIKEIQNNIVERIQETERISNVCSIKTAFPNNQQTTSIDVGSTNFEEITSAASPYLTPLGTSSPFSDFAPAWNITVLTPESGFTTGSLVYVPNTSIPILSASLEVEYDLEPADEENLPFVSLEKDQRIILDVLELNAIFKVNGNYNIEVFKKSKDPSGDQDETLERLYFMDTEVALGTSVPPAIDFRVPEHLRNSDLATDFAATNDQINDKYAETTPDEVSYYLDILFDTEISIDPPGKVRSLYRNVFGDNNPVASCDD